MNAMKELCDKEGQGLTYKAGYMVSDLSNTTRGRPSKKEQRLKIMKQIQEFPKHLHESGTQLGQGDMFRASKTSEKPCAGCTTKSQVQKQLEQEKNHVTTVYFEMTNMEVEYVIVCWHGPKAEAAGTKKSEEGLRRGWKFTVARHVCWKECMAPMRFREVASGRVRYEVAAARHCPQQTTDI